MVKFSFIIPVYGQFKDHNLNHCLDHLLKQGYKDFEIILCGNKIIDVNQVINGVTIKNVIININHIGKLMNEGVKIAQGEYYHLWSLDLIVYQNYLEELSEYISRYGNDHLYAGQLIDTRGMQSLYTSIDLDNQIYFNSFDKPEGFFCIHKKHFEPFREEFEGSATHWCQELLWRLYKKVKFIYMKDVYVIHMPHFPRISYDESLVSSQKSSELFEAMKNGM